MKIHADTEAVSISSLKPYPVSPVPDVMKPEPGDLAMVDPDGAIIMFAKGKGKGCKAAQRLVRLNFYGGKYRLVTLTE